MNGARDDTRTISYSFEDSSGNRDSFDVVLKLPELSLLRADSAEPPEWTKLEHHQCDNCPLRASETTHCPVAVNVAPILDHFTHSLSFAESEIRVETCERSYHRRGPLHDGLASLFGLVMATSGCPILDKLRPMAHCHLPFAGIIETVYRGVSTYLLGQFFRQREGLTPDWKLDRLLDIYEQVRQVNRDFSARIGTVVTRDAGSNAVAQLDVFADMASFSIAESWWEDIEPSFAAHLEPTKV